jgi:hypothetical protein
MFRKNGQYCGKKVVVGMDVCKRHIPRYNDDCFICLEILDRKVKKFTTFTCGHAYHNECVESIRALTCPACRKEIQSEIPKKTAEKIKNRYQTDLFMRQLEETPRATISDYSLLFNVTRMRVQYAFQILMMQYIATMREMGIPPRYFPRNIRITIHDLFFDTTSIQKIFVEMISYTMGCVTKDILDVIGINADDPELRVTSFDELFGHIDPIGAMNRMTQVYGTNDPVNQNGVTDLEEINFLHRMENEEYPMNISYDYQNSQEFRESFMEDVEEEGYEETSSDEEEEEEEEDPICDMVYSWLEENAFSCDGEIPENYTDRTIVQTEQEYLLSQKDDVEVEDPSTKIDGVVIEDGSDDDITIDDA